VEPQAESRSCAQIITMTEYSRQVLLSYPKRIASGAECSLKCAEDVVRRGVRRVFVVSSPRAASAGEALFAALCHQDVTVEIFADVTSETSVAHFEHAVERARSFSPDCVLGLGGGSALDLAKLITALHDNSQTLDEVVGIDLLQHRHTHLVCIPTTAGTGSEVSPNALVLDANNQKKAVISPWLVPDATYIDPQLMVNVPPDITAYTGIDALTHCIEAFANRFAHPAVDLYALEGIRLISQNLAAVVRDGHDLEARSRMALGSLYGGLCLGPVNTAAVHALAYALAGEFKIAHGLSNALLLTHVLRFNVSAAPERYAAIARVLGIDAGKDDVETASLGIEWLEQLCQACGIPRKLSDVGVLESAIPGMAMEAIKVQRLLKNNPREVTTQDAENIFRDAF
jgi:alcohol dehydrogenase class IV